MITHDGVVEKFVHEALPRLVEQIQPNMVLIFGSRARGEARSDSDLDVIVVARLFETVPFLKRMPMVLRLLRFPHAVDFLCYTPEEFEQIRSCSSIVYQALQEGKVVYQRHESPQALTLP
ncbi:MAG: nucleotidyltransferase domain-containing protein [Fimbriimonadales bacterium]|nr:nucleotidyltransferase domain-containing protein [Fimbriimonadales bacterium]